MKMGKIDINPPSNSWANMSASKMLQSITGISGRISISNPLHYSFFKNKSKHVLIPSSGQ